jgi:prolyl-tRNA editing enzyme YbaK/EbsC (Cys-tRNA(Pro) deacylase)
MSEQSSEPQTPERTESLERVQAFLDVHATGLRVFPLGGKGATVQEAADALGIEPGQIAKTLALRAGDHRFILVTRGDSRLDNHKFRDRFAAKAHMLPADEAEELTGQPVGGMGPFGHPGHVDVYCDESLRDYDVVFPAAGSPYYGVRVAPGQIAELTGATWVDVTRRLSAE